MTAALELIGAIVRRGGRTVLDGADLAVSPGEIVGVVGANGAGKTTLLRAALGLDRLDAGSARLAGRALRTLREPDRASLAAYLPQERHVGWNLPAWRIAALGAFSRSPAEQQARAEAALTRVGLLALKDRGVLDMSGGERARALLARLLAAQAPLLVADEPAAGLDPDAQLLALDLLREEAARGAAVLLTLHDLTLAVRSCDRLVVLQEGKVVADAAPREALSAAVLRQAFGLAGAVEDTRGGPVVVTRRALH